MTVLVLFGSSHVGARIIDRLTEVPGITLVEGKHQAADAVRFIAELKPEIVVLDAHLGGGAGIEVLRKAKLLECPPLVVMAATLPYVQYHREFMKEGADYFFHLPSEVEKLTRAIHERTARE